jgi:hypothetical protein
VTDGIRRLPADELDESCMEESWERATDDPDIPYWSVGVAVAEFLRTDPLEFELRQQMAAALRAMDGAEMVWEDDREVWGVTGIVSGKALVRAAAGVVDHLADRARAYLDSLG